MTTQQGRLEAFYKDQAEIFDDTRGGLLRGRNTMIAFAAAELKHRLPEADQKPVWVDLGGGTGWNIEKMSLHFPIDHFERIYLVDLCPSLCRIARERCQKFGWTNVVVLCEDAVQSGFPGFGDPNAKIDLVTMSYSLSMMDNYFPVVDRVYDWLKPETGILAVADFYASTNLDKSGSEGVEGYFCNWWTRTFWSIWFAFDHVHFHPSRREYLEHKFQIKKSINCRNSFYIPYFAQVPYYMWIGERKKEQDLGTPVTELSRRSSSDSFAQENSIRESTLYRLRVSDLTPRADDETQDSPLGTPCSTSSSQTLELSSSIFALANKDHLNKRFGSKLSQWRMSYNPTLACHTQFRSYIYAFTWEDPRIDLQVLDLQQDDVMFVITSAGDNALEYALKGQPSRIHCVDMNPCQNHLLELKLAAINVLPHTDFWKLFGKGQHEGFRRLLIEKLSPVLSSTAVQFWYKNRATFDKSFYETGYSGMALSLFKWLVRTKGLSGAVQEVSTTEEINTQVRLWESVIKPATMPKWFVKWVLSHPAFLWNALGVPINQMKLILDEGDAVEYIYDTLDPIMHRSLFKNDQYFYNLVANRQYTATSCPSYLTQEGFQSLKETRATDAMVLHTSSIIQVLRSMRDGELTKAVLMDHMDWFGPADAEEEIREVARAIRAGGMVLWRSAGREPWYNALFVKHGFEVKAVGVRVPGSGVSIDRVNMYASCYRAIKL
ncbi:hypothetical protein BGZ81_009978 [Podila clonocystis]|nr:hypothetical protein BGZ81_009978 [Podila clonocystis]